MSQHQLKHLVRQLVRIRSDCNSRAECLRKFGDNRKWNTSALHANLPDDYSIPTSGGAEVLRNISAGKLAVVPRQLLDLTLAMLKECYGDSIELDRIQPEAKPKPLEDQSGRNSEEPTPQRRGRGRPRKHPAPQRGPT